MGARVLVLPMVNQPKREYLCTCYVSVAVPESKIKIRKGRDIGWRKIPPTITTILTANKTELIQDVTDQGAHWQAMAGSKEVPAPHTRSASTSAAKNPFAVLSEEEEHSSKNPQTPI